jgi:hypothetical protein
MLAEETLAAIAAAVEASSEAEREQQFGRTMRNFLDAFHAASCERRSEMLVQEPAELRFVFE